AYAMAVLALRTESPWSRFVLAFSWWALASARSCLASSMSCRVSGVALPASAFLMVSSACLITTGQLYAKDAEPTRTSAAQRIAATTNLMHRHSSLIRRSLSRELHFFSTSGGPRAAAERQRLRRAQRDRRVDSGTQRLNRHAVSPSNIVHSSTASSSPS